MVIGKIVQPTYEVIKREDIMAAIRDGITHALEEMLSRINALVDIYSATAPSSLWTWDYTSRWDYDSFW